ncbi:regulator of G-protein signaling 14 isoform X2 [Nelusetta ayraudi]|uniref:regulator of G-protein signaling 14 isoform X2 n=1 Tax=Nelusetta ayraudi TaxID=303726 RepID=UPI003F706DCE
MVALRRFCHRFSHLVKVAAKKQRRKQQDDTVAVSTPPSQKSQAVSDGELNMSARGCGGSSSSLPGTPGGESGPVNRVLSWAVSFEKLLEDPCGVQHFTTFLMSEVSAENILFWQACEKFRKIPAGSLNELKAEARSIYNSYLSESAPYSVNIDDTAKTEEKDLERPTPDMFNKAQGQIFKLMKMDSYRRFVRSPLYQSFTLASVESKLLLQPDRTGSLEDMVTRSPSTSNKNKKSNSSYLSEGKSEKRHQKRGSWGDASINHGALSRKELQVSAKSNSSVELGSLYRQMENGRSSPCSPEHGGRLGVEGGYCCVYLPDGSASLAPTRNGQLIKDMLASLCEKRAFPLKDVVIYLNGKDKPLSLDQDCTILRDQQVTLELRVTFALEIAFTHKTVGLMAKSSKLLQDALSAVLQKHQLEQKDVVVTIAGSKEQVSMSTSVFKLANKTLRLDKIQGGDSSIGPGSGTATQMEPPKPQQLRPRRNRDMDGLLDLLTRAQCCRVDDQRGLLTKEQLELPRFLQLSLDQGKPPAVEEQTESSSTAVTEGSGSAGTAEKSPESKSEAKDLKETAV